MIRQDPQFISQWRNVINDASLASEFGLKLMILMKQKMFGFDERPKLGRYRLAQFSEAQAMLMTFEWEGALEYEWKKGSGKQVLGGKLEGTWYV